MRVAAESNYCKMLVCVMSQNTFNLIVFMQVSYLNTFNHLLRGKIHFNISLMSVKAAIARSRVLIYIKIFI